MTLRAKLFLASCALAALSLSACGGDNSANAGHANAANTSRPANASAPAATPAAPAASPAAPAANSAAPSSAGVTGVASCDEYIALYERCANSPNIPEQARATYRSTLEQSRTAWRTAASTPEGKAQLATTCQQQLSTVKAQLEQLCK